MLLYPPEHFEWPAPWEARPVAATLSAELQRECCPEHPLYGRTCLPVASSHDHPDEFLFVTDNPAIPIAFVHLTWSRETTPAFPYTVGYASWEEFRLAWHKETL